jgi:hypothetical protein
MTSHKIQGLAMLPGWNARVHHPAATRFVSERRLVSVPSKCMISFKRRFPLALSLPVAATIACN